MKTNESSSNLSETGFLRLPQVLTVIPVSKSTWWKWVADGRAPKSVKLGPHITAWTVDSIRKFIMQLDSQEEVIQPEITRRRLRKRPL